MLEERAAYVASFRTDVSNPLVAGSAPSSNVSVQAQDEAPDAAVTNLRVAPNPFRDQAMIQFGVTTQGQALLSVYDVLGREVARLVDGALEAGQHSVTLQARNLPSCVYIARLQVGRHVETLRITIAQ